MNVPGALSMIVAGKYKVERELGRGGMGAVYEAKHLGTGRRVALKMLLPSAFASSSEGLARFQREAMAAGSIETMHIAQVLDTGVDAETNSPYIVMEFLVGRDCDQLIDDIGPLQPDAALRIVAQACTGLQRAHQARVVHRDIKPANLFLSKQENGEVIVKVLDFGIAKTSEEGRGVSSLTMTGALIGSPHYMSPEQATGAKTLDHRSDIWSLGIVLFRALSGTTPHACHDTIGALIAAIARDAPCRIEQVAPWIPAEVGAIVDRALQLDPRARFQSAADMLAAILPLIGNDARLREEMLLPISASQRATVRIVPSAPGSTSDAHAPTAVSGPLVQSGTIAGLNKSGARPPPRSTPKAAIAGAVVSFGLLAVGLGSFFLRPHHAREVVAAPAPPSAAPTAVVEPPAPSVAPAPAATPATRACEIDVTPPNADVEIDGARIRVDNGKAKFDGTLGSTHRVRVVVGKRETAIDVVVAETGAVPSKVALGAPVVVAGKVPPKPKSSEVPPGPPTTPPPSDLSADRKFE